jgi:hypothetical protein
LSEAQTVAEEFLQDVAGGQVDGAYASTTRNFQTRQTLPQFREFVSQNPALQKYDADSLDEPTMTPRSATFAGTLAAPNGDVGFTLVVIKEGLVWKVDRFAIP